MKEKCTLIATIPTLYNIDKVRMLFINPYISEVRFNTGSQTPYSVSETIRILKGLSVKYKKKLWIDIKGRQLRVTRWADPLFSCIDINHRIKVTYPAEIHFRNGDTVNIVDIRNGNKLFVDPIPSEVVGAGQSVNIIARKLEIEGYLTKKDKQYLDACRKYNVNNIMASFVESYKDLHEIRKIIPNAEIVSKIESEKGIEYITKYKVSNLMAARDDLYLETGQNMSMMNHLKTIIEKDKDAICASKIFSSLDKRKTIYNVDFVDFADLELMYQMGYRKFMLSDNVCNYNLNAAVAAWREFTSG